MSLKDVVIQLATGQVATLLAAASLVLPVGPASAQDMVFAVGPASAQDNTFRALQELRAGYADAARTLPDSVNRARLFELNDALHRIENRWAQTGAPALSDDYVKALQFDAALVREAVAKPDSANTILGDVISDLRAKEVYASTGFGLAPYYRSEVEITVRTRRAGQEVNGFLVGANAVRYADLTNPMFPFTNPTSPSKKRLPPGNYIIWIEKDSRIVERRRVRIGDSEPTEIFFYLP